MPRLAAPLPARPARGWAPPVACGSSAPRAEPIPSARGSERLRAALCAGRGERGRPGSMEQGVVGHPVTLIIKAPNQKYTDQTINCFLDWTVGRLKSHLSDVYPSKPVSWRAAPLLRLAGVVASVASDLGRWPRVGACAGSCEK